MPPKLRLDPAVFLTANQSKPASRELIDVFDSHIHLFPSQLWKECQWWLPLFEGGEAIRQLHEYARYQDVVQFTVENTSLVKTWKGFVFMQIEVEHAPGQWDAALKEIDYVYSLPRDGPCPVRSFISWAPADEGREAMSKYLDKVKSLPSYAQDPRFIRGVRFPLLFGAEPLKLCTDANFIDSLKVLGENDLSFEVCISEEMHPGALQSVTDCIVEVRKGQDKPTVFVINHISGFPLKLALDADKTRYEAWLASLNELALLPDTYFKVSAAPDFVDPALLQQAFKDYCANPKTPSNARKEIADQMRLLFAPIIDAFGLHRSFYGADWPVIKVALFPHTSDVSEDLDRRAYAFSLSVYIETLRAMGLSNEEMQLFFCTTAQNLYCP